MDNEKVYVLDYYMQECRQGALSEIIGDRLFRHNLKYHVEKIVMYNVKYRDCLREEGIEGVINALIAEAPMLEDCQDVLDYLRTEWVKEYKGHIADYDVQMLPTDQRASVASEWFEGLTDIDSHVEMFGKYHCGKRWSLSKNDRHGVSSLHVGVIWNNFDDTYYHNYLFFRQPVTESLLDDCYNRIPMTINFCMVNEYIPEEFLPVLYNNSEKQYMLLATAKNGSL